MSLGKGLSSLIPPKINKEVLPVESEVRPGEEKVLQMPLSQIKANPHQPRTHFDHEGIEELVNSIREHGVLQPIILTKDGDKYEIIAGERRFRASEILEKETIPAIVRDINEQNKLEIALVENIQRRDLNPVEEAVAYQRLIDEFSLTQEEVAKRVGKSRPAVANTLRLLTLPTEVQKALVNGKINYSTARIIAGLPVEQRMPFFRKVLANDLTVRAAEGQANKVSSKKRSKKDQDPVIASFEEELQQAFGTKVSIKKTGETGSVAIEFYSDEELQALLNKLLGNTNSSEPEQDQL